VGIEKKHFRRYGVHSVFSFVKGIQHMGRGRNGGGRAGFVAAGKVAPGQAGTQKPLSAAVNKVLNSDESHFVRKLSDRQVGEWLANEQGYNEYTPRRAAALVNAVRDAYPGANFFVGNEYSRVVYVDTGVRYQGQRGLLESMRPVAEGIRRTGRADEVRVSSGVNFAATASRGHLNSLMYNENAIIRFWWD
jgi:hypothetical protein